MKRPSFGKRFERKASNLYTSRIVITVPKSGMFVMSVALLASSYWTATILINAIGLGLAVLGVITTVVSRRQVATLKDEVDFAKRGVSEDIDAPITQDSYLKDFKVNGNDPDFIRVPK